jgi:acetyltransferase-like isoleucine patch superfamily enzyme
MFVVGKYTYGRPEIRGRFNHGTIVKCGNFCSIASQVKIYLGGNHRTDWITTYPFGHINHNIFNSFNGVGHPSTKGNVNIGNDVWIGDNVTIMSGITIGDGVVIAANSHIVKDAEPYTIIGGNPAKKIKYRFTQEQISKLLDIKWWYWSDENINKNIHLLCSNNIDDFINKYKTD